VNAPKCPVHSYHRDGSMRVDDNKGSEIGYEPNSKGSWQEQPDFAEPPLSIEGAAGHWNHRVDEDYYSQPGALFRLMTPAQQQVLFENTARSVGGASGRSRNGTLPIAARRIRLMGPGWRRLWRRALFPLHRIPSSRLVLLPRWVSDQPCRPGEPRPARLCKKRKGRSETGLNPPRV
jgi:hypothetical protein